MRSRKWILGVAAFDWLAATALAQSGSPAWTITLQSGLADTFQLTLGGMFGAGPAWQNRLTLGRANAFRRGDALSVYGWDTYDARDSSHNYQAGLGYKAVAWTRGAQSLTLGSGFQHWRFPSVKTGTHDWLVPGTLAWAGKVGPQAYLVTGDSWTLLASPLARGTLLHTQSWLRYPIFRSEWLRVEVRHGPAHTYSWGFYGTSGHRVMRYQTMLELRFKNVSVEGGWRRQWGLQTGIADNNYWQVALIRSFGFGGR